jgi:hypothetical protein
LKKKVIFGVVIVILLATGIILFTLPKNSKTVELERNLETTENDEELENINEEEIVSEEVDQEEQEESQAESESNNSNVKSSNTTTSKSNSTQTSKAQESTNNSQNSSTSNTNENNYSNNTINTNSSSQNSSTTEVHYIGVPYPYDFNYSFHHGKIEYSTMAECLKASDDILLKDTTDIINAWCMDVIDENSTVLGEYLYIKCSSGNCDKYKNN